MIDVTAVKAGARLKLQGGVVAEVVENMEDGQWFHWLRVRTLESPTRPVEVGMVELCQATDILTVLSE